MEDTTPAPQTPEPEEEEDALVEEEVDAEAEAEGEAGAEVEAEAEAEVDAEMPLDDDFPLGDEEEAPAAEEEEEYSEPMIEVLGKKFVVKMRQKLRTPSLAAKFVAEMCELIDQRKSEDKTTIFEDFDISQNLIPRDQFEEMFACLADSQVQVERFRAFGCPTIDDEVALLLSGWLASVSPEMAPYEMHLSDGAIQTTGFLEIIKAIEENEAFPPPDPRLPKLGQLPLYLRLEGNYIEKDFIQEKVDEGVLMVMKKADRPKHTTEHKVRLLVREDGGYAQKEGDPPAPEDAAAPKKVMEYGKGKGKESKGKDSKGKGKDFRDSKGKGKDRGKDGDRYSGGKGKTKDRNEGNRAPPPRESRPAPWQNTRSEARVPVRTAERSSRGDDRGYSSYDKGYSSHDRGQDRNGAGRDSKGAGRDSKGAGRDSKGAGRDSKGAARDSKGAGRDGKAAGRDDKGGGRDSKGDGKGSDKYSSYRESRQPGTSDRRDAGRPAAERFSAFARNPPPTSSRQSPAGAISGPSSTRFAPAPALNRPTATKRPMDRDHGADDASKRPKVFHPTERRGAAAADSRGAADKGPSATGARPASKGNGKDAGKGNGKDAGKGNARDAGKSKGKGKGKESRNGSKALPANWEEHFSEEYSLNYFWNSKTGDSSWEKPM